MTSKGLRDTNVALNRRFITALSNHILWVDDESHKPLLIDVSLPHVVKLRVYLYNCTNPPGGRKSDEYKSQIIVPGQARGERGNFDYSDERIILFGAYAKLIEQADDGVFVFWDANRHVDFSYSANVQVKSEMLIAALRVPVYTGHRSNGETIVTAKAENLLRAIKTRIETVSPIL